MTWSEIGNLIRAHSLESSSMRTSPLFSNLFAAVTVVVILGGVAAHTSSAQAPFVVSEPVVTPEWIWPTSDRLRGQTAEFTQSFDLPARFSEAHLRLAADFTDCTITLNGMTVTRLDDYGPWLNLEVTDQLLPGPNSIRLRCRSSDGPSAIAATLTVTDSRGTKTVLHSDSSWKSRILESSSETPDSSNAAPWRPAVSFGAVAARFWNAADARDRITTFDDYTQWKQAADGDEEENLARFVTLPGFSIERIKRAEPEEGSWISMAFDPQGRLTVAREDKGLLRLTLPVASDDVLKVETINDTLLECRGLLYAYDSLYANANNSKGMYRLRDTSGDDRFDEVTLLREFPGTVGHGRNDLALGPDGLIYSIHGDAVEVPTENIVDRTSPLRDTRRVKPEREGHLIRTNQDGTRWELVAGGLRNPFGIDFNADGELFTYDADAEFDMGAPWYRPTRLDQLVSGADFGWRGRTGSWPPYELDHPGNALPVADIGKGSPTAVKAGTRSSFPPAYQKAMFILDWAYGRIVACHLYPRGAGYVCHPETFLKGRPLNVTDLDFGPDGSMYVITGGRKTQSVLYRVRYTGPKSKVEAITPQQVARREFSEEQRIRRRKLEQLHAEPTQDAQAASTAWSSISSLDPTIRQAATVALEHQPVDSWRSLALNETDSGRQVVGLLALTRNGNADDRRLILQRLNALPIDELSTFNQLAMLQSYSLCLADRSTLDPKFVEQTRERLEQWLNVESLRTSHAPTGAGASVSRKLAGLTIQLGSTKSVQEVLGLLSRSRTHEDRIHYLFTLREVRDGWSLESRRTWFQTLREVEQTVVGGDGMPGFLKQIREDAIKTLTESEQTNLAAVIEPPSEPQPLPQITRPIVRQWKVEDIDEILAETNTAQDAQLGKKLFEAAMCSRCHRSGRMGHFVGPDLTSVSRRFTRRDLLMSVLNPSLVVSEKYRNVQIITNDGRTIIGRPISSGDYRSPIVRVATDPLKPTQVVEISKRDIEIHRDSMLSPMPEGLLNTLTQSEILDLLAFLEASASH
jgi:putative heme-binding domain-containing protein